MKTQKKIQVQAKRAFTLIEMIGVLAVIAILAALLIPKIFEAINNARINNAAVSYNTVKTAVMDHYGKHGSLLSSNGVPITVPQLNYDQILLSEAFLDKRFIVKIGDTNTHVEVVAAELLGADVLAANSAYDLDGSGITPNDAPGGVVVQAVITGVTENDAKDLNDRLDGTTLGEPVGTSDLKGRVKYATGASTTVYIYVTHR
jgi:prepilin-type N-terminal cleavage/methylation domain-containing protein